MSANITSNTIALQAGLTTLVLLLAAQFMPYE